jgi:hypothetical protein
MTWLPLESKMLASVAYDTDRQFLDADSRGRFFLAHIRDRFPYERMAKLRAA